MGWTADELARLAETTGGPVQVQFFGPDHPPVTLDFSGYDNLAILGKVDNPLIQAAENLREIQQLLREKAQRDTAQAAQAAEDAADDGAPVDVEPVDPATPVLVATTPPETDAKAIQRRLETWHDEVAAAVFVEPGYQTIADIQALGRDPSKLWLGALNWERRNSLIDVLYQGIDALLPFRRQWEGAAPVRDGDGGGQDPERLPADPEPAAAVLAGRRAVLSGAGALGSAEPRPHRNRRQRGDA